MWTVTLSVSFSGLYTVLEFFQTNVQINTAVFASDRLIFSLKKFFYRNHRKRGHLHFFPFFLRPVFLKNSTTLFTWSRSIQEIISPKMFFRDRVMVTWGLQCYLYIIQKSNAPVNGTQITISMFVQIWTFSVFFHTVCLHIFEYFLKPQIIFLHQDA